MNPNQDHIRTRAYHIWEEEGRPEGRAGDHWDRASKEMGGGPDAVLDDPDLARNPGIGQSPGVNSADLEEIEGQSTVEGDILNDTTPAGGVNPNQRGRTNP